MRVKSVLSLPRLVYYCKLTKSSTKKARNQAFIVIRVFNENYNRFA